MQKYKDPQEKENSRREATRVLVRCLLESTKSRTGTEYISPTGLETLVNKDGIWKGRLCGRIMASEVMDILAPYVEEGLVHRVMIYGATANHPINGYQPNGERIRELQQLAKKGYGSPGVYEARRHGGVTRAQQLGYRIYSPEEERCAYELSLQPEYRRPDGRSDNKAIAQELNRCFHNEETVRTPLNITRTLYRYRQLLNTVNELL